MFKEVSNKKFKSSIIILLLVLSSFFGLAIITGGSILAESYERLEEFKKLENSKSLNNLSSTVSEDMKDIISIYHNSYAYELSIESDKNLLYVFLILLIVTLVITINLLIDIIRYGNK
ncbi:MAG: hypothetical protein WBJ81_03785 [Rickettsiales bacterium]